MFSNFSSSLWRRPTVAHNCHGKIFLLTAKSISPRQNQFHHGKTNFATAKSILQYGKISFISAKSFSSTAKSFSSSAKYISPRQNNFGLTCSRDISSQSAMGVNPTWRSSSWYHDSTCIASTVEIVCFEQHISACSVDKVSRYWLMFLFCDRLTFMEFSFWSSRSSYSKHHSESSDSEPHEGEFDETPRQASHEHITRKFRI